MDKKMNEITRHFVGIDIGSTASKIVVMDETSILEHFVIPTGWNGKETAERIRRILSEKGYDADMKCVATGYGRVCVDYADKIVTEITCHGKGAWHLFGKNATIIDIGGQDTKVIRLESGMVSDFLMNDKCAAGTGKFIEVMSTRLGIDLNEMYQFAEVGNPLSISSMCTVFAESEVISYIGSGERREDISAGVIDSVAEKVANMALRFGIRDDVILTGGLSVSPYFRKVLEKKLGHGILTSEYAPYAGAIGAALLARGKSIPQKN